MSFGKVHQVPYCLIGFQYGPNARQRKKSREEALEKHKRVKGRRDLWNNPFAHLSRNG
jgi:hypothetical protein